MLSAANHPQQFDEPRMQPERPPLDQSSEKERAARSDNASTIHLIPNELQRTLLESITDAFVALDRDFRYTWVNSVAERLSGKRRSELIGRAMFEVFPEAIGTSIDAKCRQALEQQTAIEFENYMPAWDRWFVNKIYPTKDDGLVIFWREITEAKRAEAQLRRQAQILEQIHDSIISTDLEGIIKRWNHGAERIFGYTPEEAIGRHVSMLYFEEDRSKVGALVFEPLRRDEKLVLELRNRRKSGEECFIRLSLSLLRQDDGVPYKALGIAIDITGQRKAESALRESEEFHRGLIEAMPGLMYCTSVDGNTTMIGGRWEEYSGVPATESLGLNWLNWIHQDDVKELKARWAHCVQTGELFQMLYRVRDAGGVYRWHWSRAVPVRGPNGAISGWVGALLDVHDWKSAETELRLSEERLRLAQESAGIQVFECVVDDATPMSAHQSLLKSESVQECAEKIYSQLGQVHSEDQLQVRTELLQALSHGAESAGLRYRSIANGQVRWHICQVKRLDRTDFPSRVVGVIVDVTAHKQAEEAQKIEQERQHLESIIHHLTEGVTILAANGRVMSMNPAALRMHGFEGLDWASVPLNEYGELIEASHLDGSPLAMEEWPGPRALRGQLVMGQELRIRNRKTGHSWVGLCNGSPVRNEKGEIVMAVVSIRDTTAERNVSEEIQRANGALQKMSAQLLRLQDEERKKIARDLHDGTLQLISAMSMNLLLISRSPDVIGDPGTRRLITEAQDLAKRSSRELRTLSYILHPPDLDELGLVVALRSWADGFAQRTGIDLAIDLDDPGRLNSNLETTLFRIAQEALANLHKHSGSPTAYLRMMVSAEEITLEIRDRGCGISVTTLTGDRKGLGVGILGMRERARQLGGSLEILSNAGGTTVRAKLPRRSAP